MIDRQKIEALLKIQGIPPTAPEEQIRSVLLSAQYDDDEIRTAITVLRENTTDNRAHVDGLHKIYRTDKGLKPAEITALLGIDVDVSEWQIKNHRQRGVSTAHYFIILGLIILLAFGGLMFAMYLNAAGPFHPSAYARK
jgi:hypothetical protein